ncbi:unnamed protein product [Zymoseptoria tritici ST99CH_1E4]|uniref:Uncharacterized protein n=1 Tax=Zymoseptoria tritici ST99CH_1E4 TaxID=1276532 RepID=A0A2H1FNV9_ZYMTR|nr:unnamed protein product [Zymoseptoria tritici ST99CH_1E4]
MGDPRSTPKTSTAATTPVPRFDGSICEFKCLQRAEANMVIRIVLFEFDSRKKVASVQLVEDYGLYPQVADLGYRQNRKYTIAREPYWHS